MKRALFLIVVLALLTMSSCAYEPSNNEQRFDVTVYPAQGQESCIVRVLTDKQTGCQYLFVCNSLTTMPHTCSLDKADAVILGKSGD